MYELTSPSGLLKINFEEKKILFFTNHTDLVYSIKFPADWEMTRVWQHVQFLIDAHGDVSDLINTSKQVTESAEEGHEDKPSKTSAKDK